MHGFQKFEEIARIKENDESVPYLYNGYYYITRLKQVKIILFILEKRKAFQQRRDHAGLQ
jgi:oligopeptidase B